MFLNLEYVARAAPDFGAQRDLCTLVKGSVTIAIKVIFGDQYLSKILAEPVSAETCTVHCRRGLLVILLLCVCGTVGSCERCTDLVLVPLPDVRVWHVPRDL